MRIPKSQYLKGPKPSQFFKKSIARPPMESLKKFYDFRDKELKELEAKRGKQAMREGSNKLFYFV